EIIRTTPPRGVDGASPLGREADAVQSRSALLALAEVGFDDDPAASRHRTDHASGQTALAIALGVDDGSPFEGLQLDRFAGRATHRTAIALSAAPAGADPDRSAGTRPVAGGKGIGRLWTRRTGPHPCAPAPLAPGARHHRRRSRGPADRGRRPRRPRRTGHLCWPRRFCWTRRPCWARRACWARRLCRRYRYLRRPGRFRRHRRPCRPRPARRRVMIPMLGRPHLTGRHIMVREALLAVAILLGSAPLSGLLAGS